MKRYAAILLTAIAVAANSACLDFATKSTTVSASAALGGTWATVQSLPGVSGSIQDSCVNFNWAVTSFTGTTGSGTFSATCLGNVQVVGSASGTLTSAGVTWAAQATGTAPGAPACAISISGTATLEANNRIRIPYSGMTCLGPVSGTEVVQR